MEAYKSYHGFSIDVLDNLVKKTHSSYGLWKTINFKLSSPKSVIGRLTFKHRAAIAWNSLTDSIKNCSTIECFKEELKANKEDLISLISYNKFASMIRNTTCINK